MHPTGVCTTEYQYHRIPVFLFLLRNFKKTCYILNLCEYILVNILENIHFLPLYIFIETDLNEDITVKNGYFHKNLTK